MLAGKNLMLVAHPDDETIFGYTLLRRKNWHVVCLTHAQTKPRCDEFRSVLEKIGVTGQMMDYPDIWGGGFDEAQTTAELRELVQAGQYDHVVTHNAEGEYGHSQHCALHKIVLEVVERDLFVFAPGSELVSFDLLREKLEVLNLYQSQKNLGLFEWRPPRTPHDTMMKYVVSEGVRRIK